jgi:hypothetical protein
MGILDQIVGNAGNTGQPRRGLLGAVGGAQGLLQNPATMDLGLAMLANSGYNSRRRGFGEILGTSMLQSRQMAAEAAQAKLREQYMQAQIQAMNAPGAAPQRRIVKGPDGLDYYEDGTRVLPNVEAPAAMPKPRESRTVNVGNMVRTEEFNPETGRWELLGEGPRWNPNNTGTVVNVGARGPQLGTPPPGMYRPIEGEPGLAREPGAPDRSTEGEKSTANFVGRMQAAEPLIGDYAPSTQDYMAATSMMKGGALRASISNQFISPQGQRFYQAAADWVRAKLRKESGAVIGPEEMEQEIKTYFPVPGDKAETIQQKKSARAQAAAGMLGMAGTAAISAPPVAPSNSAPVKPGKRVKVDANGNVRP